MVALATAFVTLKPDLGSFKGEAEKGVESAGLGKLGEKHGHEFGTRFRETAGKLIEGVGALLGGIAVVDFFKDSIKEAEEAAKVTRLTAAVLASTGGAAHVSAEQVHDFAEALAATTGVNGDVIQSGENVLLTFTQVRNSVGKGNDIFNQGTTAALNLSAALGQDMQSSVIQVGKALNDPIAGMTALKRVGVSFTDSQKEAIKTAIKHNDLLGAQKIILKELSTEFGGAAAAATTPAQKAKEAWRQFKEEMGSAVLPIIGKLATFFSGTVLPLIRDQIVPRIQEMAGWFKVGFQYGANGAEGMAIPLAALGHIVGTVWDQVKAFWTGMRTGAGGTASTMQQLGAAVRDYVVPAISALVGWLSQAVSWLTGGSTWAGFFRSVLGGAAVAVLAIVAALRIWAVIQAVINALLSANPIGVIIVAIAALVAGVIYAYTHFKTFHDIVDNVWHGIVTVALWAWNNILHPIFNSLVDIFHAVGAIAMWLWHFVIEPVFLGIGLIVRAAWFILRPIFEGWVAVIRDVLVPVILWLWRNVVTPAMQAISIAIQIAWAIIRGVFQGWKAIIMDVIVPAIMWLWHHVLEPAIQGWVIIFHALGDALTSVWRNVIKPVFDLFGNIISNVVAPAFRTGVDAIKTAWNKVSDVAKVPINFVIGFINKGIIHPYNTIAKFFGVKDKVDDIAGLATGGLFHGQGGPREDANLVRLSNKEFVVNAEDTARALPILEYINSGGLRGRGPTTKYPGDLSGGLPGFAGGGLVGWLEDVGKDIWDAITDPVKFVGDIAAKLLSGIPGGQEVVDLIGGEGHKLIDDLVKWVKGTGGGSAGGAMAFLKGAVGHGYGWAMAGPDLWDCSGIVSSVYNVLHGKNPYSHTFSTSNEAGFFPIQGLGGILSAGWTNPGESGPGGNSVGHTAAVLAGVPFESTGSGGVHMGGGVTPIGSFAHVGHYAEGGLVPGPYGMPRSAIVHGGERVYPPGPMELSDATIEKLGRAIGREITGAGRAVLQTARAR